MPCNACRGQKATLWSLFPLSAFVCTYGIELKSSGLRGQNFYLLSHLCQPVRLFLFLCVSIQTFCCKSINQRDYMRLARAPLSLRILKSLKGKISGSKFLCKKSVGLLSVTNSMQVVYQSRKLTGTDLKVEMHRNVSRAHTAQSSVSRLLLTVNCRESLHRCLRGNTLCPAYDKGQACCLASLQKEFLRTVMAQ